MRSGQQPSFYRNCDISEICEIKFKTELCPMFKLLKIFPFTCQKQTNSKYHFPIIPGLGERDNGRLINRLL